MAPRSALLLASALILGACLDQQPKISEPALEYGGGLASMSEPTRYLVGVEPGATIAPEVLAASGGRVVDSIPELGVLAVEGVSNPDAIRASGVRYIQAEFTVTVDATRGDPIATNPTEGFAVPEGSAAPWYASGVQWDLKAMKADEAWAITNGGDGAMVCIVDSGIDALHQELNAPGKVVARANFVTSPAAETAPTLIHDPNGHGSHVASETAARGVVMAGVAPRAGLLGARVLNTAGSGSELAITRGIRWCADNGAHVINMSLGGIRYKGQSSYVSSPITYKSAIDYAIARGSVIVVSAGNSNIRLPNTNILVMPAQVPGTIIVGSTGPFTKVPLTGAYNPFDPARVWHGVDGKAFYSNFGTGVTVFAPGGRGGVPLSSPYRFYNGVQQGVTNDAIWGACSGQTAQNGAGNGASNVPSGSASCMGQTNRYIAYNGTSMAAPHVAGMAAVLYAELGNVRSPANRSRVMHCITSTTDVVGPATTFGGGRVNVKKAVDALRAGSC